LRGLGRWQALADPGANPSHWPPLAIQRHLDSKSSIALCPRGRNAESFIPRAHAYLACAGGEETRWHTRVHFPGNRWPGEAAIRVVQSCRGTSHPPSAGGRRFPGEVRGSGKDLLRFGFRFTTRSSESRREILHEERAFRDAEDNVLEIAGTDVYVAHSTNPLGFPLPYGCLCLNVHS